MASQHSQVSDILSSSQLCYLELLQEEMPTEVLDLDFFWNPEGDVPTVDGTPTVDEDEVTDSQLVRIADEIEFCLPSQVITELAKPFAEGKIWFISSVFR